MSPRHAPLVSPSSSVRHAYGSFGAGVRSGVRSRMPYGGGGLVDDRGAALDARRRQAIIGATRERTDGSTQTTSPGRASRHANPETQECGPDAPFGSTREAAAALSAAA